MKKAILPVELWITFNPSAFLWGWWLVFSILNMGCVLWGLHWLMDSRPAVGGVWACIGFATFIMGYGLASYRYYRQMVGGRGPRSVRNLRIDVYGRCWLHQNNGVVKSIQILPDTVVSRWLICLHVQTLPMQDGFDDDSETLTQHDIEVNSQHLHRQWLLILPDMLPTKQMRELRVWLRWGRLTQSLLAIDQFQ